MKINKQFPSQNILLFDHLTCKIIMKITLTFLRQEADVNYCFLQGNNHKKNP